MSLDSSAPAFLGAFLPGIYAVQGVALVHIDIAYGIVYLVGILLVVLVAGHTLQFPDCLLSMSLACNLASQHLCVQAHNVWGIGADYPGQCLVGRIVVADLMAQLSQQVVKSRSGDMASLILYDLFQQGYSLLVLTCLYQPCRTAVVVALLYGIPQAVLGQFA